MGHMCIKGGGNEVGMWGWVIGGFLVYNILTRCGEYVDFAPT